MRAPRPSRWRSRCSASNGASRRATSATMASKSARVDVPAAEALGQRHDADRQRRPGGDAVLHLEPLGQRAAPLPCLRRDRSSQISSEEPPPMSNTSAKSQAGVDQRGAARDGEPGLGLAVDDLDVEAGLVRARAPGTAAPLSASRQASVAISPSARTRCGRSWRRTPAAPRWCARWPAPTGGRLADTPSPRRMMRENASMTWKPRRDGRATSSRQLLVPRSSAAYAGLRTSP